MSTLKKSFAFILRSISWIEETFLCLLLFSMILLACVQIFLRFFFSGGFAWADPLLRYMVLWAGFFVEGRLGLSPPISGDRLPVLQIM